MADEKHVKWLLEGVEAWNERRQKTPFTPDLSHLNFIDVFGHLRVKNRILDLDGIDLSHANLAGSRLVDRVGPGHALWMRTLYRTTAQKANFQYCRLYGASLEYLSGFDANFVNADFTNATLDSARLSYSDLRGAVFRNTSVRGAELFHADVTTKFENADAKITDISGMKYFYPNQLEQLKGDQFTKLHDRFSTPEKWLKSQRDSLEEELPSTQQANSTKFTAPAEFYTKDQKLHVSHFPTRPQPRNASATPVNEVTEQRTRKALAALTKTLCQALRKYKREDRDNSNRVRAAEQLLITTEALLNALEQDAADFLPTLMQDYINTLDYGFGDDMNAFESNDTALAQNVINRGHQLCAFYPELAEISDPTNTRFIPDSFPLSAQQLESEALPADAGSIILRNVIPGTD